MCSHRILTELEQSSSHPSDPSSFHFIRHISNSHSMWGRAICMLEVLRKAIKQPPFTSRLPLIKLRVREAPVVGGGCSDSVFVISMKTSWFSAESLIIQSFSSLQAPNSDRLEISPWQHCYFIALKRLISKMLLHFGPYSLRCFFFPTKAEQIRTESCWCHYCSLGQKEV